MNRIFVAFRAALLAISCTVLGGICTAQDDSTGLQQDGVPKDGVPKEQGAPPASATATPDSAAVQAARDEYHAKLTEWKELLKEMRGLKVRFDLAQDSEVPAIREQWLALVARGGALIPQLRVAGGKAYVAAPKEDRELERFLVKILKDDIDQDRYEQAAELGKTMVDAGCEVREVADQAGVAAFCVNDYDSAEKYLKQAQQSGVLSDLGGRFLSLIPAYREYWAKEQAIRQQEAEKDDLPRVKISTNKGDIVVELFENEAPGAVGNFISLIEKGFYENLVFHRVLKGFMAQGGCPQGTGTGGPGYNIYCECYQDNHRKHFRGTLSMAKSVSRDSGGSQFFMTFIPTDQLNGLHTAFGRVIEGLDVLAELQRIDPDSTEKTQPVPDKIVKMEVLRKRDHDYKPSKVQ